MPDALPLLSICIPTRNRAAFLRELLESIAAQITPEVEIVISDDGSTDDTTVVVAEFEKRLPHVSYERRDPPLLYDRNVLAVVAQARAPYCWLFGDDDRMRPGAIAAVLHALRENRDLTGITVGRVSYDHDLKQPLLVRALHQQTTALFERSDEAFLSLLDRLGFLSCQIVNRRIWTELVAGQSLERYFTGYIQLFVIARMLCAAPRWLFLEDCCVDFRADNDSFRALGMFGRLKMDVCGYETIVGDVFGRESRVYRQAMSEVARTHARHHIVVGKRLGAPVSFVTQSAKLCLRHYWRYPMFWLTTFPLLLLPRSVGLFLRRIYQQTWSRARSAGEVPVAPQ